MVFAALYLACILIMKHVDTCECVWYLCVLWDILRPLVSYLYCLVAALCYLVAALWLPCGHLVLSCGCTLKLTKVNTTHIYNTRHQYYISLLFLWFILIVPQ